MQKNIVFAFISVDKPGVVEALATVVAQYEGNWLESRMSKLTGKFAGIVQVTIASDKKSDLERALKKLQSPSLEILIDTLEETHVALLAAKHMRFSIIGLDRQGIVREITQALANKNINVLDMHSLIQSAPMSGETLFKADMTIAVPEDISADTVENELAQVCNRLDLDWDWQ